MATKTHFQPPHGCSATNPNSASASGTHHKAALAALGTTRCSPNPISPFRGFSAQTSNTPTQHCPTTPIPDDDPGDEGPDNNDNNNPDDDDPSNGPGDDGPGDDNPDENDPEDELDFPDPDTEPMVAVFDSLAKAIKLLACNACTNPESSSRTKLHKPDTFDGTNPKKLCAFLIQTNCTKVIFMQSYLKGMALEWFGPDLLRVKDPDDWPLWMDSWREFILELQTTFSPHDPVTNGKSQLNHLHMKDSYGDGALCHHFYSGLPDQIKDKICQVGKPQTLHELCHLTQEIDACYREHKEEIQQASKHQGSSSSSNNKSGSSSNNSQPKTSQDKAKTGNNNNSSSSPKPGNNSDSSKPEPSKLSKDGKLTLEECKHHIEGNLCMFCRGPGHFTEKCPKKTGKAKAHATATTEAAPASGLGSTPKTKKIGSSSQDSTQTRSCVDSGCANLEARLNVSTLSSPNSLTLKIASQTGLGKSTVSQVLQEIQPERSRLHGGHPSKLSSTNKRAIVQQILTGKAKNAVQATHFINSIVDSPVSSQTVRNTLREASLKAVVKKKKSLLSTGLKKKRLAFALKYQHWTVED
ncbi:hypothetical protein M404DRAFT_30303 [Pisolithus tinctorius Marx 270]|uniref:Transposase Tc1-like domain-containing protein n=1 Tax=Pisolithus tinctorius Marx 270 TaxID=870435 RepID=A0A0C3NF14_PISTI|nr:hypothetical protein M404DRAFT_30303 [Pisolithus tinctorius Marx 270]